MIRLPDVSKITIDASLWRYGMRMSLTIAHMDS